MDNKYGLGGTRVATEHRQTHHKTLPVHHQIHCLYCGSAQLVLSPTMQDHCCSDCGEWQNDIPQGYSTGRSSEY